MLWSDKDSKNLERIANAVERLAGIKTFVPSSEKLSVEVVEENNDEEQKIIDEENKKISTIMSENKGNHVWEETNLEEEQIGIEEQ